MSHTSTPLKLVVPLLVTALFVVTVSGCGGGREETVTALSDTGSAVRPASVEPAEVLPANAQQYLGDMDGDGTPSVGDAIKILRIVVGLDPANPCADANQNGGTDVGDAIMVLRIVVGLDDWPIGYCNPLTGRWEGLMEHSGGILGEFGVLLTQDGSTVTGSMFGYAITNGTFINNRLQGVMQTAYGAMVIDLLFDGTKLSGAISQGAEIYDLEFHKVHSEPTIPDITTPRVVSAHVAARWLYVEWSKRMGPGYDCVITALTGPDEGRAWGGPYAVPSGYAYYDPATRTHRMYLRDLLPGTYEIMLETQDEMFPGDPVDWHDLYGIPAWSKENAYRFTFTTGP